MLVLLRPIPVRSLLRDFHSFHSDLWPGANCSLVGIGSFARCLLCRSFVPPIMLALLFEEVVTVAGLHEGSSSLISGRLGGWLVVMTGMASVISLPPAFSPAGYRSAKRQVGRYQPGHIDCQHS